MEILIAFIGFLLFPISHYSFNMKAIESLYMVKTNDKTLLKQSSEFEFSKKVQKRINAPQPLRRSEFAKKAKNHYPIKFNLWNLIKVFVMDKTHWQYWCFTKITRKICCCLVKNMNKAPKKSTNEMLLKLYRVGEIRIQKEMSMEKLSKSLKYLRTF